MNILKVVDVRAPAHTGTSSAKVVAPMRGFNALRITRSTGKPTNSVR
jgi:hypothetical protein